jgi:hypothetical protein
MPLLQHLVSFPDPRGHADKNFMSSPSHARLLFCNFPLQIPLTNFIEFDRKLSNLAFSIATSRGNPSQVVFRHFPHSKKTTDFCVRTTPINYPSVSHLSLSFD